MRRHRLAPPKFGAQPDAPPKCHSGLEPAVIDHPVSSITHDEIDARVRQIKEKVQRVWTAG
jgi:hypothetical protein